MLLSCNDRWALMHERRGEAEPTLAELLARLAPCDLVLIEGFKQEPVPKLEVYRPENGKPPLFPARSDIVAVASDGPGGHRFAGAALERHRGDCRLCDEHP